MKRRAILGLAVSTSLSLPLAATPAGPGEAAMRESDIAATVEFLASPELEGRGAAERGGAVASAFIAARLRAVGFLPAGDGNGAGRSFFQSVPATTARFDAGASSLRVARDGSEVVIGVGEGGLRVVPDRAASVEATGALVFAGFGIRAPEHSHDDYAGLEVRGKIVVALSGEPGETDPQSPWNGTKPTRHLPVSTKRALASSLGATALLVVTNPDGRAKRAADLLRGPGDDRSGSWLGPSDREPAIPLAYLEPEAAARLRPLAGSPATLRLAYAERAEVALRNVVARLGAGRGLDGEVVVLAAHFDHLGTAGGVLHPGADDNASGIAALLAIAEALRAEPPAGGREIVLAAWTGEEHDRIGSTWFATHPVVPRERIASVVNLDMLGRANLDRDEHRNVLQVIYSAGAPVLREIARGANDGVGFDLRFYPSLRFRPVSDHASFADAGLPIVYPFSGYHADYHAPTDTPDKVSPARVARAARYVARLVRGLAAHDGPIRLDPEIREAPAADPFDMPYRN